MDLSLCIVNTNGREHLLRCLAAIRETLPESIEAEVLVLDNASDDGSVAAVVEWNRADGLGERLRLIPQERRAGKAENDSVLLREARGELCLLLNEDSELRPGAIEALVAALRANPRAAVAGAQLLAPDGSRSACAWRLPGVGTALAQALFLHRLLVTQSGRGHGSGESAGCSRRRCSCAARRPSRSATSTRPSSSTRTRPTSRSASAMPAGRSCSCPRRSRSTTSSSPSTARPASGGSSSSTATATSTCGSTTAPAAALAVRLLTAWNYAVRTVVAAVVPGQEPGWYWLHARKALRPSGAGIREAAEEYNRRLERVPARPARAPA